MVYYSSELGKNRFYFSECFLFQEENPKPRKFDLPNEESGRFRNGISNTGKPRLGIPDDGIPELGLLEQSIPELDTHNTYIILVV